MGKTRDLFFTFLKIGAFTFGGGYAMLALLEDAFVEKRSWLSQEEFLNLTAVAESTPGPMAVNSATYIGYKVAGLPGAAVATLGVCLPSFVVIYCISLFLDRFLALRYVGYAFRGIQVCVVYLVLSAGVRMLPGVPRRPLSMTIFGAVLCAMVYCTLRAVEFSSVYYILLSGAAGLGVYLLTRKGGEERP